MDFPKILLLLLAIHVLFHILCYNTLKTIARLNPTLGSTALNEANMKRLLLNILPAIPIVNIATVVLYLVGTLQKYYYHLKNLKKYKRASIVLNVFNTNDFDMNNVEIILTNRIESTRNWDDDKRGFFDRGVYIRSSKSKRHLSYWQFLSKVASDGHLIPAGDYIEIDSSKPVVFDIRNIMQKMDGPADHLITDSTCLTIETLKPFQNVIIYIY